MELNLQDMAARLGVAETTVQRWLREADIPCQQVGDNRYRFEPARVLQWAAARGLTSDLGPAAGPGALRLANLVEAGGILYDVPGGNKDAVLEQTVQRMRLPADLDPQALLRHLLAREALGSTAIGDGIALPHVRDGKLVRGPAPVLALAFLRRPVDFDAPDGKPVDCLLVIATPTVPVHLELLSRIAAVLRDPGVKAALARHASRDEILAALRRVEAALPAPLKSAGE